MATKATAAKQRKATAKTAAAKPSTKATTKKAAAEDKEPRLVGLALIKVGSKEFNELSPRRQAWVKQHADVAPNMKNVSRILEHNKGLYFIHTTTGMYQVGKMSASGKSFVVDFESESRDEALEYYRDNRGGNYGGEAEAAPSKKAPAAKRTPKAKKAEKKSAKPKAKPKAKAADIEDDDDLDDFLEN